MLVHGFLDTPRTWELVLPALERGLHSYTFSDVSAAFFPGAHQKLANFPEVETRIFDLEKSAAEQGFDKADDTPLLGWSLKRYSNSNPCLVPDSGLANGSTTSSCGSSLTSSCRMRCALTTA